MGGAQPLAGTMAGASVLVVECDALKISLRLKSGYLSKSATTLKEALGYIQEGLSSGSPVSVGLLGNAAEIYPLIYQGDFWPSLVTDQTAAHDPIYGYLPAGWTLEEWRCAQKKDTKSVEQAAKASMKQQVEAMIGFYQQGVPVVDYGNNIRQMAFEAGLKEAFCFPGFVPSYIRPLFCRGIGPFRWIALSGDAKDIAATDAKAQEMFPDDKSLQQWLSMAQKKIPFQGLPARICWIGLGGRRALGLAFNEMVRRGEVKGPIVIGRDHLDSGSVASPNRETEGMLDGSDTISDWPLLNGLLNCASGATWVSLHHGGGVGMGYSQHAGIGLVCDGSALAEEALGRVLFNDPATGVMRHSSAGYKDAKEFHLDLPYLFRD